MIDFLTGTLNRKMRRTKYALWIIGIFFALLALARPQMGTKLETVKREGIDLVVCLDLSNSMLAEDVKPNRLAKAKYEIKRLVEMLQGDRVALVTFAGNAFLQCPLTTDYDAFLMLLDAVNAGSMPVQGTDISQAIETGRKAFVEGERKYKVMLLITDGEDNEGKALDEAEKAKDENIKIFTVGIGSPAGVPIPVYDDNGNKIGVKRDRSGNVVTTRLDEETLQRIALATDGKYYPATPSHPELDAIISAIANMEKKEIEAKKFSHYEERFQYPLGAAILFIILAFVIPERQKKKLSYLDISRMSAEEVR